MYRSPRLSLTAAVRSIAFGFLAMGCGGDNKPAPESEPMPKCEQSTCNPGYACQDGECKPVEDGSCSDEILCASGFCVDSRCVECVQASDCGGGSYEACEDNACKAHSLGLETLTPAQWTELCTENNQRLSDCQKNWFSATFFATCGATVDDFRTAARVDKSACDIAADRKAKSRLPVDLELGFSATNLGSWTDKIELTGYERCTAIAIDTDQGVILGCPGAQYHRLVQQGGGDFASELGVFIVDDLTVEDELLVGGERPLVLIARGSIHVSGAMRAVSLVGGAPAKLDSTGLGLGGDYGGGGYCTAGKGDGSDGGPAYGNPELSPLLGGSSGDSSEDYLAGRGGAAVHLIAGKLIEVGISGVIDMSGETGHNGGSGGAILLQAPAVSIAGALKSEGGRGTGEGFGGGNDGASGRIRIDTETGKDMIADDALLSAAPNDTCVSKGTLSKSTKTLITKEEQGCTDDGPVQCAQWVCCEQLAACEADSVCDKCDPLGTNGPGCDANEAFMAYKSCLNGCIDL